MLQPLRIYKTNQIELIQIEKVLDGEDVKTYNNYQR